MFPRNKADFNSCQCVCHFTSNYVNHVGMQLEFWDDLAYTLATDVLNPYICSLSTGRHIIAYSR